MADAAYKTFASTMSWLTRGNLREFASRQVLGITADQLASSNSVQSNQLNTIINQVQARWRRKLPGIQGFGERKETLTWVVGDTRLELPANFAELHPSCNGRITLCDTAGDEDDQLEVVEIGDYESKWRDGSNVYTDRDDPVAYLYGISTNNKRFIEIVPNPTTAVKFNLHFIAHQEVLDNDADYLTAPLEMHEGIQWDCAAMFGKMCGHAEHKSWESKAEKDQESFLTPFADERKRPKRVMSFEEAGGYRAFDRAE